MLVKFTSCGTYDTLLQNSSFDTNLFVSESLVTIEWILIKEFICVILVSVRQILLNKR